MIKILHINTYLDQAGAAKSVMDLSNGINQSESSYESTVLAGFSLKSKNELNRGEFVLYNRIIKYINALYTRVTGYDSLYYPFQKKSKIEELIRDFDIIHLHNLHGYYIDYEWLFEVLERTSKPVVWTLRDYWVVTGKCCFPTDESIFKKGCNNCDCLNKYPKAFYNRIDGLFKKKKGIVSEYENIQFVTLSDSMKERLLKTYIPSSQINVIYNGFNLEEFEVQPKSTDKYFNILFIASRPDAKRKGLIYLLKALSELDQVKKQRIFLHIVGKKIQDDYLVNLLNDINHKQYGYINDNNTLDKIYKHADIFVNPTLDETFGRTSIEALLRGIPVVAFDLPILREVLGNTGYYAEVKNPSSFKNQIEKANRDILSKDFDRKRLIERGNLFSIDRMVNNYLKIYSSLIS